MVLDGSAAARPDYAELQRQVGLVFQTPELQLFAASAREDVAFGPRRLGWPEADVAAAVDEALELVGLPPERFGGRHPYALSGGEQRRLALAGVLAMRPRLLLLDEPFVSLDPATRRRARRRSSRACARTASPSCSPPTTSTSPGRSATSCWCSTTAGWRRPAPGTSGRPAASCSRASRLREPFLVRALAAPRPRSGRRAADGRGGRGGAAVKPAIAQYYPGESVVHRLDAARQVRRRHGAGDRAVRARLVRRPGRVRGGRRRSPTCSAACPPAWFWRAFRPLLWLVGLTFLAQVLFAPGEPFFSFWIFHFSWAGLEFAAFLSLRLRGAGAHRLGAHAHDAAARAHRRPRLARPPAAPPARAHRRAGAHGDDRPALHPDAARGAGPDHARPARPRRRLRQRRPGQARARALVPVLTPLFVLSFRRADELALAMEARCYRPGVVRTRLHPLRGRRRRRRPAARSRRPSSSPGCSCRMPA